MRASDYTESRRRFLRKLAGIGASVAISDELLDVLDGFAPRRAMVGGYSETYELLRWYHTSQPVADEFIFPLVPYGGVLVAPTDPIVAAIGQPAEYVISALREKFLPGTMRGIIPLGGGIATEETLRLSVYRDYGETRLVGDAVCVARRMIA